MLCNMKSIKLRSKNNKKKNELQMYQINNLKKRKKNLGRKTLHDDDEDDGGKLRK